jgi:3-deoxy-D-manno-octulosonic-acid transferase
LSFLLNLTYCLLLVVVSPILAFRSLVHGKYREGWSEKFLGNLPDVGKVPTGRERYWFHAVSVGEVLLLQSIIPELKSRSPAAEIVLTTTTSTGHAVAREKFPNVTLGYFPLDFSWIVRRAISRIQPTQIVLVELELWPNFLKVAQREEIPVSLVNARLSEKSFRGYSRIRWLLKPALQSFNLLAVQNETYAERFLKLGAQPENVHVTGSVKFDRVNTDGRNVQTQQLRKAFELGEREPVFITGSTQDPEEKIALETWLELRNEFPELRLIIVPRHKERFEEVARLVESYGVSLLRRSHADDQAAKQQGLDSPVILLDTLGELSACWGLADFAYVGGSMGNRGGQNMIEPCGYGAAVCFGPNTRNFRDVVSSLLACHAAKVVEDQASLATLLREWLNDRQSAIRQGIAARDFVVSQAGATQKTVDLLLSSEEPVKVAVAA